MDFNFVTARLATGARILDPLAVEMLIKAGITHIINCQAEHCDRPFLTGTDLRYIHCPTHDDGACKDQEWFQPGIEFALAALAKPNTKVYTHCAAGINRGPSMCYAVLRAMGLDAKLAWVLIKEARPEVNLMYRHDADVVIKLLGYE